ncbi:MAG: hypothetical protein WCK90_02590 [archaeon]
MTKKPFFAERSVAQIRALKVEPAFTGQGLVERISDLGRGEALELKFWLMRGEHYQFNANSQKAARKAMYHEPCIKLDQAKTVEDALRETRQPHEIRRDSFDLPKSTRRIEEIYAPGFSFVPIYWRDGRVRIVPLADAMEGQRLASYAFTRKKDAILVRPYDSAKGVEKQGAHVAVIVPSTSIGMPAYKIKLSSVPVVNSPHANIVWTGFSTTYHEGKMPESKRWRFGFASGGEGESRDKVFMDAKDIAAMHGVWRYYMINEQNPTSWNFNPFPKFSQRAVDFYRHLCNNVVVFDRTVESNGNRRKLNSYEKSVLLVRLTRLEGHDKIMFWQKVRDPDRLEEYDWSIPR